MLRPLYWLLRWVFAIVLLGFAVAAARVTLAPLGEPGGLFEAAGSAAGLAFLGGFAVRWVLARRRDGDPLEFVDTLEHELTHAVAGTLTFAPPVALTATLRGGGEVELKRSNPIAALAPYCLPLYAAVPALLTLVLLQDASDIARLLVAALLGSFAWRLTREFHFGQTDFREFGLVFSMVFIAAALPLCLLGVLNVAGLVGVPWRDAGAVFLDQARAAAEFLRARP